MKNKLLLTFLVFLFAVNCCFATGFSYKVPLPGASLADAKLQYDTLTPVYLSVRTIATRCHTMSVVNTKVTKGPYNLVYGKNNIPINAQWEEAWTVRACSRKFEVPVGFALDSRGVAYQILPQGVKLIQK